jgi:hypothetical protein
MRYSVLLSLILLLTCCQEEVANKKLALVQVKIGTRELSMTNFAANVNVPFDQSLIIQFADAVDESSAANAFSITSESGSSVHYHMTFSDQDKIVTVDPIEPFVGNTEYTLMIDPGLKGKQGELFAGDEVKFTTSPETLRLISTGFENYAVDGKIQNVPTDFEIDVRFSKPLNSNTLSSSAISLAGDNKVQITVDLHEDRTGFTITSTTNLDHFEKYKLDISSNVEGANGEKFAGYSLTFYTALNATPKFPVISDDDLLTLVQQQTFKYFWDFAHPVSGMARERNSSGDIVTTGGTGFGLMSIVVGIERGFITRTEGVQRIEKIVDFLTNADRFHGAWPHWMNGSTGGVIPFSPNDNGGDLVETSFLIEGLLTVRQYLDPSTESTLIAKINNLWNTVEWDWYTKGEDVLYWHWSPTFDWIMNHQIRGHNETLITYVLAASSTTYPITADVYHKGYARAGAIKNGNSFYGITLPLGENYGGPLFFTHYSFLGLDPRNLQDQYANYWEQNVNHALINRAYVIDNPKNFVGYSENNWGLTASDNQEGYSAHSPTNDLGVITPTAALSSFPYTPSFSMDALKFFYYTVGDKLWGDYGFYDAYNPTEGWVANSYLAIDQGPIIIMIENHRSGLLWNLFMSAPEVQSGLNTLGFTY